MPSPDSLAKKISSLSPKSKTKIKSTQKQTETVLQKVIGQNDPDDKADDVLIKDLDLEAVQSQHLSFFNQTQLQESQKNIQLGAWEVDQSESSAENIL